MAKITNDLLKQAIADAEAVRETAVANAKLVLEESITPQIRDMIARRLRVEAENADHDTDEKEELEEEVVEETADEVNEAEHESATEKPHEDGEAVGGADFPADSSTVGAGDNKEPSDDSFDKSGIGDGGENVEDNSTDWYDDWSESDFDLDEVIRELEEDINALSEKDNNDEDDVSDEEEAAIGHAVGKHEKEMHEEEDEEHLSQKDPHAHAKAGLKMDGADADMHSSEEDGDEELDLEAILRELEAEDSDEDDMAQGNGHDNDSHKMAAELARFKSDLDEYKEAVKILRSRLQEVNLLNAKLLYTNKMFRKDTLTNEQKVRIVESFDRATTTREVKLVYTALVENLATAAKTFNASRKKVVAEGLASKATPTTAPKSKEVIVENTVAKRLQQLAGII
jgi:hypothetical protein